MHILILGGNSIKNEAWAYKVEAVVKPVADSTEVHEYAHWQRGELFIDLERELADVAAKAQVLTPNEYIIVGKSMGAVLTAKGLAEGKFHPKACVLIGTPLREIVSYKEILFKQWLESADCDLVFVQNRADPLGSADALRDYLNGSPLASRRLIELPSDTHDYSDMPALRRAVEVALTGISDKDADNLA